MSKPSRLGTTRRLAPPPGRGSDARPLHEAATASHNRGVAAWLWHDAARVGAKGVGPKLAALVAESDSPVLPARAAHVIALDEGDAEALAAASARLQELGLVLLAAEAAWSASDAYRKAGDQRVGANLARQAGELAARCDGVRTPGLFRPDGAVPLTAREREIASLAGQGLSSPEIAERLYVSVPTPARSSASPCGASTTSRPALKVAGLAAASGVSRAALAADLLREPGATVGSVAHQVGYGSPFALSTAFKRVRGISPNQHRLAHAG